VPVVLHALTDNCDSIPLLVSLKSLSVPVDED